MPKISSYGGMTPILTDLLYGVDDPGGTPISNKMTITALRDLVEANFVNLTATNLTLGGDAILERDAANELAQRNGTNGQDFHVYNTFTDASNYTRLSIRMSQEGVIIDSNGAGTGINQDMFFAVGDVNKISVDANNVVMAAPLEIQDNPFTFSEMSAPSGESDKARLFVQDNGSGKTQLMVIFGTGSSIQLAIEA